MALTINDVIVDEEIRNPATPQPGPQDETEATLPDPSAIKSEIDGLGLTFVTTPTGFPQYATNTISSTNTVTGYSLSVAAGGVPTTLSVGSNKIFLYAIDGNPDIVVGRIGSGTTADPNGAVALVIAVDDSNLAMSSVWMGLYAPLVQTGHNLVDSADQLNLAGLVTLNSTYNVTVDVPFENFNGVPSGNNLFNVVFPSAGDKSVVQMLLTGIDDNGDLATVNVSTTGIGAGSQHIDVGHALRIDTVQGMTQTEVDQAPEVNMASHIVYSDTSDAGSDARVESFKADFEITQLNPGSANERVDIRISCFNVGNNDQQQEYLDDINDDLTPVAISASNVIVKNGAGQTVTGLTIIQDPNDANSVIIRGLDDGTNGDKTDGWQVFFTTSSGFDRLVIANVDDSTTFDVGNFHFTTAGSESRTESTDLGVHLKFQDDGPNIDLASGATVPTIRLDETTLTTNDSASFAGLFTTPDYGADLPGTLSYILGVKNNGTDVASGLTDTLTGESIVLNYDSVANTVTGTTATTDLTCFVIGVNSSGTVSFDQQRAVVHTDTGSDDEDSASMVSDLITLTARVVDSEGTTTGDSDSATANIAGAFLMKDDGPGAFNPADINGTIKNQAGQTATGVDLSTGAGVTLTSLIGADGFKSSGALTFYDSNTTNNLLQGTVGSGSLQNLTSGGASIYLYGYGTGTLTASTDSNSADGLDSTKTVFTITLDKDADTYAFNMLGHIDNGSTNVFLNFAGQKQTIYDWLTLDLPASLEAAPPSPDDGDILFTGVERASVNDFGSSFSDIAGVNDTAVNVSSKGIGVGSQSITVGKGVFIDFVNGAPLTPGHLPLSDMTFTDHTLVDDSGFGVSQLKPTNGKVDVRVSIYAEDGANDPGVGGSSYSPSEIVNNDLVNIDSITIQQYSAAGALLGSITVNAGVETDRTLGGRTLNFNWGGTGDDDWVVVTNLGENYRVVVNGETSYNQMLVENVGTGNEGFDVSGIVYHQASAGDSVHMDFDIRLLDGDSDPEVANFGVTLAPPDLV